MILSKNLTCRRGSRIIFRNLNFKVEDGIATIISGNNGTGKTSLLRILCNLLTPKSGDVIWKGQSIYKNTDDYLKNITYIADINSSKNNLTVIENMTFWKNLYKSSITYENFMRLIDNLNLRETMNQYVNLLSQGQKRKLELSRLIIEERNIWIMDEPFLGLDQDTINIIGDTISDHLKQNGTVILSSHVPIGISQKTFIDIDFHESN